MRSTFFLCTLVQVFVHLQTNAAELPVGASLCVSQLESCSGDVIHSNKHTYSCSSTGEKVCTSTKVCQPHLTPMIVRTTGKSVKLHCVLIREVHQSCSAFRVCDKNTANCLNGECVLIPPTPFDECAIVGKIRQIPDTQEHGLNVISHGGNPLVLVDADSHHMSCVDARTNHPVVGAFGGDMGELLLGFDVLRRSCPTTAVNLTSYPVVLDMVKAFVNAHTTEQRPLYMHTDDKSMKALLDAMKADRFPVSAPENKEEWFAALFQPTIRYHGCGHIWYQVTHPDEYDISVDLIFSVLRAFFDLFWDPEYARRLRYEIVLGNMDAHAVVVQKTTLLKDNNNNCKDKAVPMVPRYCPEGCPSYDARDFIKSQNFLVNPELDVFVLHGSAVERHHQRVSAPFFLHYCPAMRFEDFLTEMEHTAERHNEASLHHLAEHLPVFTVEVDLASKEERNKAI